MLGIVAARFPGVPKTIAWGCFLSVGLVLLSVPFGIPVPAFGLQSHAPLSSRLDEALRASDLDLAKNLILEDVGAADELFLRYLRQDIEKAAEMRETERVVRAERLAGLFFKLFDFDLELGVITYWQTADLPQKRALLAILQDHFAVFKEERALDDNVLMPFGWQDRLVAKYSALAERHHSLPFPKGELFARLRVSSFDASQAEKTWQLAKNIQDPVGEAWAAYYYGIWSGGGEPEAAANHAVKAAEELHLPRLHQLALTRLAWRALSRDDYEAHVGYFRKGLDVIKTIPIRETLVGRMSRRNYPGQAWFHMVLWRAGELNNRPDNKGEFDRGLALAREYGGRSGELAYLIEAMPQFLRPGLFKDVAARADSLARRMGDRGWLVRVLMTKVDGLTGTQEFDAAIQAATEAAGLLRKMSDRGHLAECLSKRAVLRAQADRFDEAAGDFRESIGLYNESGFEEAAFSTGMDAAYYLRAKPALAEEFYGTSLAAAEKKGADDLISQVLYDRGKFRLSRSPEAGVQDLKSSLVHEERANEKAGKPGESSRTINQISQALRRVGRFSEAIDLQKQRAEKARARQDDADEADAYFWLQQIYALDLGDIGAAMEYVKKYQVLIDRPEPSPGVNELNRLALGCSNIGQPGRALAYWHRALDLAEKAPGKDEFERMVHNNLESAYLRFGDYGAALEELGKEKGLIETTFEAFHAPIDIQKAQWFNKAALVHTLAGDTGKAVEASLEAIRLESKVPPGTSPADYYSYYTPGDALALAGRNDEAIAFYEKRRDKSREVKSAPDERAALEGLGKVYLRAGDIARARESLQAAVEVARKPPFLQTGKLAASLLALAELELGSREPAKAEGILAEARSVANSYDRHQLWQIERVSALAAAATGKLASATDHFERAEESLERAYERLRPEEFLLRFGIDRSRVYDEHALFLADLAAASGRQDDIGKALRVVEGRRLQALWDLMATGWARLEPEAVPEQLQRVREAETSLAAKQNILRAQFGLPPEKRDTALIGRIESDLEQARDEHAHLLASLAQGNYRYSAPGSVPADLSASIQKKLRPRQALVEYLIGDERGYAFVITSAGLRLQRLEVGRAELRREVQSLLQPFYRLRTNGLDLTRIDYSLKAAHELYRQVFAPLEALIGGTDRLIIVPDDVLCYLPFEALVEKPPRTDRPAKVLFAEYESADFLLDRFSISYLSAAAHVLLFGGASPRPASGHLLLAMANPTAKTEVLPKRSEDQFAPRLRSAGLSQAFSPLPRTAVEIEKIGAFFPKNTATLLTGASATESGYKTLSGTYEFVHLATHAVAADDQPLYSNLILAPEVGTREDGVLQAYEILRFPLRAKLVVLSACETARGPLGRGEGLVGLVSAFRQAGAEAVLATQWSIDESAAELMTSFYRVLTAGRDACDALREAKLRARKGRLRLGSVEISTAHPFFWAPFVLIGSAD
jgi:CHAT domain-containing protein